MLVVNERVSYSGTKRNRAEPRPGGLDPAGELVTARTAHTATLLQDGRVLVTGGTDINGDVLATAELYK